MHLAIYKNFMTLQRVYILDYISKDIMIYFLPRERKKGCEHTCLCFFKDSTGLTVSVHRGLLVRMMNTSTDFPFSVAHVMGSVQSVLPLGYCNIKVRVHGKRMSNQVNSIHFYLYSVYNNTLFLGIYQKNFRPLVQVLGPQRCLLGDVPPTQLKKTRLYWKSFA